jgi:hypothetical protein
MVPPGQVKKHRVSTLAVAVAGHVAVQAPLSPATAASVSAPPRGERSAKVPVTSE